MVQRPLHRNRMAASRIIQRPLRVELSRLRCSRCLERNDRYATLANVWATMVGIVTDPLGDAIKNNKLVNNRRLILSPLPFCYRQTLWKGALLWGATSPWLASS